MSTLAERITQARKLAGIKYKVDLARKVGVSAPTVTEWESGEIHELKADNLHRLAKVLCVRPEWILSGREPMRPGGLVQGVRELDYTNGTELPGDFIIQSYIAASGARRLLVDVLLGLRPDSELTEGARGALRLAIKLCPPPNKSASAAGMG
jgi:transcriptional regulator with XRE-family HTH domain